MRLLQGTPPFESDDPGSSRIFWRKGGVHQNLTFAVHPGEASDMHCWPQKVTVEPAYPEDAYGDIYVDTNKAYKIYQDWPAIIHPHTLSPVDDPSLSHVGKRLQAVEPDNV